MMMAAYLCTRLIPCIEVEAVCSHWLRWWDCMQAVNVLAVGRIGHLTTRIDGKDRVTLDGRGLCILRSRIQSPVSKES